MDAALGVHQSHRSTAPVGDYVYMDVYMYASMYMHKYI